MSKKNMIKSILIIAFSVIFVNIMLTLNVFADGGGFGDDGGGSMGAKETCLKSLQQKPSGYYSQFEKCGAAFQLFDINDKDGWPEYASDKTYIEQNVVPLCSKVGANQFYFLALARATWSGESISYKGTIGNRRKVKDLMSSYEGGSGSMPYIASVGIGFDEVLKNHQDAINYAKNHPEQDFSTLLGTPWEETTGFCWNQAWTSTSTTSTFGAWSTAVAKDSNGNTKLTVNTSSLDSSNSGTLKTKEDTITIDFKHRFNYEKPTSGSGKFDPAITKYGVQVSGAVYQTVVPAGTQYTVTDSGPDRTIGPLEPNTVGDSTQTINVPETGSVKVCSKISYDPKVIGWKSKQSGGFEMDPATTKDMGKSSEACVIIERAEGDEEETEDGGQIRFWSTSTIQTPAQNGDVNFHEETSDSEGNGKVTIKLSTDSDKLNVNFWHTLYYKHEARDGGEMPSEPHTGQDKLLDDICTTYGINQSGTARNASQTLESGEQFCVDKDNFTTNMQSSGEKVKKDKYSFNITGIGVGQTVTVCQKISYQPEIVTLMRTKKTKKVFDGYFDANPFDAKEMEELYFYNPNIRDYTQINIWDTVNNWEERTEWWYNDHDGTPIYNNTGRMLFTYDWDGNLVPVYYAKYHEELDHYEYTKESDQPGEGYSEACIEVTRPADPTKPGDNGTLGPYSGKTNSSFLYTGESTSDIGWNVEATAYKTRRLIGAQAILFDPTVFNSFNSTAVKGTIGQTPSRTPSSPCEMYKGRFSLRNGCSIISNEQTNIPSGGIPGNQEYVTQIVKKIDFTNAFTITDRVGDKYCNSFGFYWQYWYGVRQERDGQLLSENWNPENQPYWTNYDAACRTIVKKPSTSIWNGGIFTNGDIKTSLSNRYLSPRFADINGSNSGNRRKFGSWTEHLATVGGSVITGSAGANDIFGSLIGGGGIQTFGFSSGGALAFNGSAANDDLLANSPLTIANTGSPVGGSGIGANSTYRARLSSYLLSNAEIGVDLKTLEDVTNTRIIRIDGDVNITQKITVKDDEKYNTIYQLPQIIIYARGNINIGSDVERIDAWLISGGTVNTCSDFTNGSTEAYVSGYNSGTDCSKPLTINGPIIAQEIKLNRSAGADPISYGTDSRVGGDARGTSGEVFNLSADTYLWAYAQAGRYGSSYSEAYTRELPPRY